jgi:adenylate kinase
MPEYIVLLGPPGVGKGTQAKIVAEKTGLPHVSSGDLFRENIKNKTQMGNQAQAYIAKGELVPDDITIGMIRNRLSEPDCKKGALLDGFPRTINQAAALEKMLVEFGGKVDCVPYISAPESTLVERLSGRWTCRANGHVFHEKFSPSRKPGKCDLDGSDLYQREDDKVETVSKRIQVYLTQTAPLIEYFRKRNILCEVDGAQPIENVTTQLLNVLGK